MSQTISPLETLRSQVEAASQGPWENDEGDIFVPAYDGWTYCRAHTLAPENGEWTEAQANADAAIIITSVAIARFLASDEAEEALTTIIVDHSERWRSRQEAARAILTEIARRGVEPM